jgi:hypothetical protein
VGSLGLDALKALVFEMGPPEGDSWFHLPEDVVRFSKKKSGKRGLIIRRWGSGPLATVYARSTSDDLNDSTNAHRNPAHDHRATWPACWFGQEAWVVTSRPLRLAKDLLGEDARLCTEEDAATIAAVMAGPT